MQFPDTSGDVFPLDVLIFGMHFHSAQLRTAAIRDLLKVHSAVRSYGSTQDTDEALALIRDGAVNTLFVDPGLEECDSLIRTVRAEAPHVVIVIYGEKYDRSQMIDHGSKYEHYFWLESPDFWSNPSKMAFTTEVDAILRRCQEWHKFYFEYDVAISFAGADRDTARQLASALSTSGVRVFFDEFAESELLGKNLYEHLHAIYSRKARFCLMLISAEYAKRVWTSHERRSAQERALFERGREYILPVRLDGTELPGLFSTIAYIGIDKGVEKIARTVRGKLFLDEGLTKRRFARNENDIDGWKWERETEG